MGGEMFGDFAVSLLHKHGGGFLHIVAAGMQKRVGRKHGPLRQIASLLAPRHRGLHRGGQVMRKFVRIEANAGARECFSQSLREAGGLFGTEHLVHFFKKSRGQRHGGTWLEKWEMQCERLRMGEKDSMKSLVPTSTCLHGYCSRDVGPGIVAFKLEILVAEIEE